MDYEPDDAERPLPAESLNGCRLSSLAVAFAPCLTRRRPPNWGWPDGLKPSKSPLPHKPKSEPVSYVASIACLPPSPRQRNPCLTHCGEAPQLLGYGLGPGHVTGLRPVGAAAGAAPAGRNSYAPGMPLPRPSRARWYMARSYAGLRNPRLRAKLSRRTPAKTKYDRHEKPHPHIDSQQHDQRQRRASASAPPLEQHNQPMRGKGRPSPCCPGSTGAPLVQHSKDLSQRSNNATQTSSARNSTTSQPREHLHRNRDRP